MRKGKKKAWSFKKEYVLGMMSRLREIFCERREATKVCL